MIHVLFPIVNVKGTWISEKRIAQESMMMIWSRVSEDTLKQTMNRAIHIIEGLSHY